MKYPIYAMSLCNNPSKKSAILCPLYETRLLWRFAPIFYFNCEHVLIVILKNKEKKFADFIKKRLRIFKILRFFTKIKNF